MLAQLADEAMNSGASSRLTNWLRCTQKLRENARAHSIGGDEETLLAEIERSLAIAARLVSENLATNPGEDGLPRSPRISARPDDGSRNRA